MSGSTRVPCQSNKVKMVQCLLPFVASTHFSHLGDVDFKPLRIFMKLKLMSSTACQDDYQILGTIPDICHFFYTGKISGE